MTAQPDRLPDGKLVAEEFGCVLASSECDQPGRCWQRGRCMRMADRKPVARKKDVAAMRDALRLHPACLSCETRATDGHHVVFRSHGGDDVVENIASLCHLCHMEFHNAVREVVEAVGAGLLWEHIAYVRQKMGLNPAREYLWRRYRRRLTDVEVNKLLLEWRP